MRKLFPAALPDPGNEASAPLAARSDLPPHIPAIKGLARTADSLATSLVVPALREAIVDGSLAPGSRLSEVQIGRHYGVSRTPVREAFAQLEREGLLLTVQRAGAFVREIDERDVAEIYETREALETQAARLATRRLTAVGKARIDECLAALAAPAAANDAAAYVAALDRFYEMLMNLAGNATLRRSYEALSGPVRRLRRIAMRRPDRMAASLAHARAIVAAIASGDQDRAERELREQLTTARIAVTSVLRHDGDHA
jgi:DNA-binding GntR family transcriptional regulator